jgi:hypothetical protein
MNQVSFQKQIGEDGEVMRNKACLLLKGLVRWNV